MFLCSLRYCLKCNFSKGVYSFTLSTVHDISVYFNRWCTASDVKMLDDLKELMLLEQCEVRIPAPARLR